MADVGLRERYVFGVSWAAGAQAIGQALMFATTVVLARVLLPRDFGVIGMATIFTSLVTALGEMGLVVALIQKRDVDDDDCSTIFWAMLGVCAAVCVLLVALSPFAAGFFRTPVLVVVIPALSLTLLIDATKAVQKTLLTKQLEFRKLAFLETVAVLGYGATAIGLALGGAGVWSLVVGAIVRGLVELAMVWRAVEWRPRFRFSLDSFRRLFGFGVRVWGYNVLDFAREQIDYFTIGRVLGAQQLGLYTLSYKIANMPRSQLFLSVGRVNLPALAEVSHDAVVLQRAYTKIIRCISMVSFPLLVGLAIAAPQLVPLIYGPKWAASVVPMQVLAIAALLYSLITCATQVFMVKGRPDLPLKIAGVSFAALLVMVIVGVRFGIVGVACAVLTYALISFTLTEGFANALMHLPARRFLAALVPASVGTALMAAVMWLYIPLTRAVSPAVSLATSVAVGAIAYLASLWVMRPPELRDLTEVLVQRFRPVPPVAPSTDGMPDSDTTIGSRWG